MLIYFSSLLIVWISPSAPKVSIHHLRAVHLIQNLMKRRFTTRTPRVLHAGLWTCQVEQNFWCVPRHAHLRHKSPALSSRYDIPFSIYSSRLPRWQISRSISSVSGFVRLRRDEFAARFAFCFCRGVSRREHTGESPAEQANIDWRRRKSRGAARAKRAAAPGACARTGGMQSKYTARTCTLTRRT